MGTQGSTQIKAVGGVMDSRTLHTILREKLKDTFGQEHKRITDSLISELITIVENAAYSKGKAMFERKYDDAYGE